MVLAMRRVSGSLAGCWGSRSVDALAELVLGDPVPLEHEVKVVRGDGRGGEDERLHRVLVTAVWLAVQTGRHEIRGEAACGHGGDRWVEPFRHRDLVERLARA